MKIEKNRLREVRRDRLMTQADLAKDAGVSLRTINAIENQRSCWFHTKRKILIGLGIPFEDKGLIWPDMQRSESDHG